ncbi:MAG: sigma-70 family RNA polymerase sigma factor [Archangiaceae bacterium]|nr:sigma-70 family RNA polymerase sigma factor [Archangiaceae bacterium]
MARTSPWLTAVEEAWGRELEGRDRSALGAAERHWSAFAAQVDADQLGRYCAELLAGGAALHWQDVVLAAACGQGIAGAITVATEVLTRAMRSTLRRRVESEADLAEATQRALTRILTGPTKLREYRGRAPLASWAKVVATRDFLNSLPAQTPLPSDESDRLFATLVAPDRPELEAIRAQASDRFRRALDLAVTALSAEERRLLRARFVEDVDLKALAEQLEVDRATVVRRLARARDRLRHELLQRFEGELGVAPGELESLLGVLRSQPRFDLAGALASLSKSATKG